MCLFTLRYMYCTSSVPAAAATPGRLLMHHASVLSTQFISAPSSVPRTLWPVAARAHRRLEKQNKTKTAATPTPRCQHACRDVRDLEARMFSPSSSPPIRLSVRDRSLSLSVRQPLLLARVRGTTNHSLHTGALTRRPLPDSSQRLRRAGHQRLPKHDLVGRRRRS
ncbi:hypothetical protein L227DRAFT_195389 [Lentinus tigrinus ALCF2SS1-6]|uniref:Uncharacterized protein n=1 Tax=Lentinus tigrinus ALCF2SS1-6 TaxID=1328759 RepID=A0A5C2S374_9APHY|nr:hypothetical protein L227DRAFT_195389 [Lentinus tigrinus ALCF2SS1-6]